MMVTLRKGFCSLTTYSGTVCNIFKENQDLSMKMLTVMLKLDRLLSFNIFVDS